MTEMVDIKSMMSTLLANIKHTVLMTLLDLGSEDSLYSTVKDAARNGQQHIECLAVIFSGSQNGGKSFCNDRQNPFLVRRESCANERGTPVPRVSWKENYEAFFPTLADLERNQEIPTHLFTRGFLKKTGKSATPKTSSSKSAASFSDTLSSTTTTTPLHEKNLGGNDLFDNFSSTIRDLGDTPPMKTSKRLFENADVTDHYVLDQMQSGNRGYCSLLIPGTSPLAMEFNLDETCSEPVTFPCLPGTHRWMLYKDIATENIKVYAGFFVSIISIDINKKITCCTEIVGPADILSEGSPQMYRVKMDYFRTPEVLCTAPLIIEV